MENRYFRCEVLALCIFMVAWILVTPGLTSMHDSFLQSQEKELQEKHANNSSALAAAIVDLRRAMIAIPNAVILKHRNFPVILSTHHLGAIIWSVAMPIQFLLPRSTPTRRLVHRVAGYSAMTASALLTIGFCTIMWQDLHSHKDFYETFPYDFPTHPDTNPFVQCTIAMYCAVQVLFVTSAILGVAAARRRDFTTHRKWMLRHLGAGQWVIIQRAWLVLEIGFHTTFEEFFPDMRLDGQQKMIRFVRAAVGAIVASCVGIELYIAKTSSHTTVNKSTKTQ